MKDWKACERKVAALLGGKCGPVSSQARGHSPDIEHQRLSIEVKSRKQLPAWIEDAMKEAEAYAQGRQLPLVVLHQDGQRYEEALMVMRLKDVLSSNEEG